MAKRMLALILGILLLVAPLATACGGKSAETTTVVKVGFLNNLTGASATSNEGFLAGQEVYYRYANDENLIPGVKIELVPYDVRYDSAREILGYQKLKQEGVVAIQSASGSALDKIRTLADQDQIPIISNSVTKLQVIPPGYILAIIAPFEWCGEVALQYIHENWDYQGKGRNPRVAGIGWNMAYGMGQSTGGAAWASEYEVDWLGTEVLPVGTMDCSVNARRIADLGADYCFANLLAGPCASFLKELYVRAPGQVTCFIGAASFAEYFTACGEAMEGHIFTTVGNTFEQHGTAIDELRTLMDRYYPDGWEQFNNPLAAITFPGAKLLVGALQKIVEEQGVEAINGTNLYEAMLATEVDCDGIYPGKIMKFSEDSRCGVPWQNFYQAKGGQAVYLGIFEATGRWPS